MIDLNSVSIYVGDVWREPSAVLMQRNEPFTKSNGTVMAKIYERLTKASRRAAKFYGEGKVQYLTTIGQVVQDEEAAYRQGVYDTLRALQEELA